METDRNIITQHAASNTTPVTPTTQRVDPAMGWHLFLVGQASGGSTS
jgi:hypothetical protein